jgi:lysophospholipase L1-like esterase
LKNAGRIIKAVAALIFVAFAAWGVAMDVYPMLMHRMDDFPLELFDVDHAKDIPNRRTQFIADENIQIDMPVWPLNTTMRLAPQGASQPPSAVEVSFWLHVKPQIELDIAFEDAGGGALICRFSSIPNPKTLSIILKDGEGSSVLHMMELPRHVHVGERVMMRAIKTPDTFELFAAGRVVVSLRVPSPETSMIALTTGSTPTQIDRLRIETKGQLGEAAWVWGQAQGKALVNSSASAMALALLFLLPVFEISFLRWLMRGSFIDSILIAAFAWTVFPVAYFLRTPWPPYVENYPLQAVALGFIAMQAAAILMFLPRPQGLAPQSDPPPFFELMAQGGRFDRRSKSAIFYELIGLVFVGLCLYRKAPTPVLLLTVFALFGPGSIVTIAALAWKTPSGRMIPLMYGLFIPALALIAYASFYEPDVQVWAPAAGTLIVGGLIIASAIGLRFRKGSHYWLPALALSLGLTIFIGETATRLAVPGLVAELHSGAVFSGDWRIDRYTNFLGNNADLAQIPTATGSTPAKKAEGLKRIVCLGTSTTAPGRIENVYPQRLEKILKETLPGGFEVINGGMPGGDDLQIYIYLRDILMQSAPDMVIYYFGRLDPEPKETRRNFRRINSIMEQLGDADPARRAQSVAAGSASTWAIFGHRISKRLVMAAAARRAYKQAHEVRAHLRLEAQGPAAKRQRLELNPSFEDVLSRMARLCAERGVTFIMIPQIARNAEYSDGVYSSIMTLQDRRDNAVLMNIRDEFKNRFTGDLFYEYTYMSAEGHDFMAQVLAEKLAPFFYGAAANSK